MSGDRYLIPTCKQKTLVILFCIGHRLTFFKFRHIANAKTLVASVEGSSIFEHHVDCLSVFYKIYG
jgi:hypothetical protein